jgi:hypothetical protein
MAEKRMIKKSVVDSDMFLDMPVTAQNLYFHLNIRADDDGFIDNPKKVQRMIGSCDDDMKLLIAKQFLLIFDSGVLVIKHWRLHNTLRKDRYSPTIYKNEFALLGLSDSNEYVFSDVLNTIGTEWQPTGNVDKIREDKRRIEKNREEKISLDLDKSKDIPKKPRTPKEDKKIYGEYKNVQLTDKEHDALIVQKGLKVVEEAIIKLDEYKEQTGKKYKSDYLAMKNWVFTSIEEQKKNSMKGKNPFLESLKEDIANGLVTDQTGFINPFGNF